MNVSLARTQACYLEKLEDRLIHLVKEHNALYEKEWFSGLRFFKSRKPKDRLGSQKRSTGACKARLCHWAGCSMEVRSPFLLDIFCSWCWLFYSIEQPSEYNANNWNIYATIYLNEEGWCKEKMPVSSKALVKSSSLLKNLDAKKEQSKWSCWAVKVGFSIACWSRAALCS